MIIVVIEPVISMLHISGDTKLDFYYDTGESEDMEEDSRFYARILERLISEYMNSTYGENYTVEVECKEGYSVESVVIENSEGTEEAEAGEEIRNNISSNFGISVEKISIK
jgi:hypothetical protein